jgi:hypothetical protein
MQPCGLGRMHVVGGSFMFMDVSRLLPFPGFLLTFAAMNCCA